MAKKTKKSTPRLISPQEAAQWPAMEFADATAIYRNPELEEDTERASAPDENMPASEKSALDELIRNATLDECTEQTTAKLGQGMLAMYRLVSEVHKGSLPDAIIYRDPLCGRPFKTESKSKITLTIDVVADNSKVTITGDENCVTSRSNYFILMFTKICRALEEKVDYGDPMKRDCDFVYPLRDKDDKEVAEDNASKIAQRLRTLLMKCVPPQQRLTIRDAIGATGTSLVISPSLRFRLSHPGDVEYKEKPLEVDIAAEVAERMSEIWVSDEERQTVVDWFTRRIPALGVEEYKRNWPFIRKLLDMPE